MFSVGQQEIQSLRMIERHYFGDQLIRSYDFTFGYCIPGSTNEWEAVYAVPGLDDQLIDDMISNPFETKSDSFYFVDDKLIMHNKAAYQYLREDTAQAKSYARYNVGTKVGKQQSPAPGKDVSDKYYEDDEYYYKGGTGEKASSKDVAWSKEEDYY